MRDYYPIYRRNGPPLPGKSPLQFVVPPDALYFSDKEQWRYLKSLGWDAEAIKTDPMYQDSSPFEDPPSEYIAGLSAILKAANQLTESE